jgi:hypothetical protein
VGIVDEDIVALTQVAVLFHLTSALLSFSRGISDRN